MKGSVSKAAAQHTNLTIRKIEAIPVKVPMLNPIVWARGSITTIDNVVVVVTLSNGVQGIADAPPRPSIYGETQRSLLAIIREHFAPELVGLNAFDVAGMWSVFDRIVWNVAAKGAVDMALFDAQAKTLGISCAQLLGGTVKPLTVNWRLRLGSIEDALEDAEEKMANYGFKAFKVKCGHPDKDIPLLRALRKLTGDDCEITLDMNQSYSSQMLIQTLPIFEELDIALIEEPIPQRDHDGKLLAASSTTIPISGDDSCMTTEDTFDQLKLGAIRSVVIKCARGGYTASRQIAAMSKAFFRPYHNGSQGDMQIGTASAGHFACTYSTPHAHEISAFLDAADHVADQDLVIKNGKLILPDGPGIGLTLDMKKLKKYRIDI